MQHFYLIIWVFYMILLLILSIFYIFVIVQSYYMTLFSRCPGCHSHRFLSIILRAGPIHPHIAILGLQIGIHEQFHIIQRLEHRIFYGIVLQHGDPLFPTGTVGLCPAVSPHAVGTVTGGALDIAEQNDCCQKCPVTAK